MTRNRRCNEWSNTDAQNALGHIQAVNTGDSDSLVSSVASSLVHRDPAGAEEIIDTMSAGADRDRLKSLLALRVSTSDLERSMALIDDIEHGELRHQARIQSVTRAFANNPDAVAALVDLYDLGNEPSIANLRTGD